jgi:hypothetical protein
MIRTITDRGGPTYHGPEEALKALSTNILLPACSRSSTAPAIVAPLRKVSPASRRPAVGSPPKRPMVEVSGVPQQVQLSLSLPRVMAVALLQGRHSLLGWGKGSVCVAGRPRLRVERRRRTVSGVGKPRAARGGRTRGEKRLLQTVSRTMSRTAQIRPRLRASERTRTPAAEPRSPANRELVMKGSPVRVRASAWRTRPAIAGVFAWARSLSGEDSCGGQRGGQHLSSTSSPQGASRSGVRGGGGGVLKGSSPRRRAIHGTRSHATHPLFWS